MNRKEKVLQYVAEYTQELVKNHNLDHQGVEALIVSQDMGFDRANVSRDLNQLWKDGALIKIQEKPVLYLAKEVLLRAFSIPHLPSLIAKEEVISVFLTPENIESKTNLSLATKFDQLIGAKDTLAVQVANAKAAVSYPPYGLSVLLSGPRGVGKWEFANSMFSYALENHYRENSAKIIRIDCLNFQEPGSAFFSHLCGNNERKSKGVIEECNQGIVYFDNIQTLHFNYLEQLKTIMEKRSYSRIGDYQQRNLNCMFVAAVVTSDNDARDLPLYNSFPIHIKIPEFKSRNLIEQIEIILNYFAQEAMETNYSIRFHKDILMCFLNHDYEDNLNELLNEIKQSCAKAHLDAQKNQINVLTILFQHLSLDLLSNTISDETSSRFLRILSQLQNDYILINKNGASEIIDFFQNSNTLYGMKRMNQFIDEFNADISKVQDLKDYINENITVLNNCGNAQIEALSAAINPHVIQVFQKRIQSPNTKENFHKYFNSYFGVLLHISNLIKRGVATQSDESYTAVSKKMYPSEYEDARKILHELSQSYTFSSDEKEIDFVALYLAIANQWSSQVQVAILIVSHGKGIATSMLSYLTKETMDDISLGYIDFSDEMQLNDLLELVTVKALELDKGVGVAILVDFEPLLSISDYLRTNENISCRVIQPLSLPLLLEAIDLVQKHYSLNQIAQHFNAIRTRSPMDNEPAQEKDFVTQLVDDFIQPSASFINAYKATDILMKILEDIAINQELPITKELTVKFLCHCIHMLERTIKKEPLSYPKLNSFIQENKKFFHMIEKALEPLNENYGIYIQSDEIAYICEVFKFMKTVQ